MSEFDPQSLSDAAGRLQAAVRDIPDFPQPGILFRDITPILRDAELLRLANAAQLQQIEDLVGAVDVVVGIEARGFLFGPSLARELRAGFVPARKPGKLPGETLSQSYGLEYGHDELHIHRADLRAGDRVVVVDDQLAKGGTAAPTFRMVADAGAQVIPCSFFIEIAIFGRRAPLEGRRNESQINYE